MKSSPGARAFLGRQPQGITYDAVLHLAERVATELEWAAECGRLRIEEGRDWTTPAYIERIPDPRAAPEPVKPEPPYVASTLESLDWLEIVVRDEEGLPIAGARCIIRLADGSVLESLTGADGLVRADAITPGVCSVEFPDLDATEWHADKTDQYQM